MCSFPLLALVDAPVFRGKTLLLPYYPDTGSFGMRPQDGLNSQWLLSGQYYVAFLE